jgi:para-aminobenzoate synthetase/4-amino-4-deoxychorismate lyase
MRVSIRFENKPLIFNNPRNIISCFNSRDFAASFEDMEAALKAGYYLAGFLSYEAGYCFEEQLSEDRRYDFPLVYFGVYDEPLREERAGGKRTWDATLNGLRLNIDFNNYSKDIQAIRNYIRLGDVYQITYCIKLFFDLEVDTFKLYNTLLLRQPVPYPAYVDAGDFQILSLSPEMFIKKQGSRVVTKPMKGTWPRGEDLVGDFLAKYRLKFDKKNRAENVMIADLLRNDLGRVGNRVRAPKLFEVAKYATLHQMTSTVTAELDKEIPVYDLFAAIFPSGSVTGAPKIRAMQIIRELEREERRIYTGAIGYISPDKDLFFNVPIRTILNRNAKAEMGIGGGIVWDSTSEGEWNEGLLKARFISALGTPFDPIGGHPLG